MGVKNHFEVVAIFQSNAFKDLGAVIDDVIIVATVTSLAFVHLVEDFEDVLVASVRLPQLR